MNNFENAYAATVLQWEGGYSNDPNDPGGETKYGISKRSYPDIDIRSVTVEDAAAIYKRDYWEPLHCGELPYPVAMVVFDTAVNQGKFISATLLQEVIHAAIDGVVGSQTIALANSLPVQKTIRDFTAVRILRYADTKNFDRYGHGWINRAVDVLVKAAIA